MWGIVIMIVFGLMVISAAFWIGFFVGLSDALDMIEEEPEGELQLHCFQCENEMPVIEINGHLHCHNCGLLHTNDYC